jgi:hypothetical protein
MGREEPDPPVLYIDAEGLAADCGSVDALARLALDARRRGVAITVRRASPELRDLIELAGLSEVLLRPRSTGPRC